MKGLNPLKAPFGTAKFARIKDVSYRQWEDAFAVEFDDGLAFLEPHKNIRAANRIDPDAVVEGVELDHDLRHGFFVRYNNGQTAEVSWAFIRELPPKNPCEIPPRETSRLAVREKSPKYGGRQIRNGKP